MDLVCRVFQANIRTKMDSHRANYAQLMKRVRAKVVKNVIYVRLVDRRLKGVLLVRPALRENMRPQQTHVWNVLQVLCRIAKTVQYVNSVAQTSQEKVAKREILLARPAI